MNRGSDGQFDLTPREFVSPAPHGGRIHYRVTLEPFLSEVFFLLSTPQKLQGNYRAIAQDAAGNVFDRDPDHPITRYEAESQLSSPATVRVHNEGSYPQDIRDYLQLPQLDPRVKGLAEQITERASMPAEKAATIENYLRSHYGYTLQLPRTEPH